MIKEPAEIECMRNAAHVADAGISAAQKALRIGIREIDVAAEAEYAMRQAGAEGWASVTYVASGLRSAIAHGPVSLKLIEDVVVVVMENLGSHKGKAVRQARRAAGMKLFFLPPYRAPT